jgi:hypothetical protein
VFLLDKSISLTSTSGEKNTKTNKPHQNSVHAGLEQETPGAALHNDRHNDQIYKHKGSLRCMLEVSTFILPKKFHTNKRHITLSLQKNPGGLNLTVCFCQRVTWGGVKWCLLDCRLPHKQSFCYHAWHTACLRPNIISKLRLKPQWTVRAVAHVQP